jgi:hypothetical protein
VALIDLDALRAQVLQQAWERLEGKRQAPPVRREVEDGAAVAGDDDGLALLDRAGELGEAVLRVADRHRLQARTDATVAAG